MPWLHWPVLCRRRWSRHRCRDLIRATRNIPLSGSRSYHHSLAQLIVRARRNCSIGFCVAKATIEDRRPRVREFPPASARRFAGKPRAGWLSVANSVPHAVLVPRLRFELAGAMGIERAGPICDHNCVAVRNFLPGVVARIFAARDGFRKSGCCFRRSPAQAHSRRANASG